MHKHMKQLVLQTHHNGISINYTQCTRLHGKYDHMFSYPRGKLSLRLGNIFLQSEPPNRAHEDADP